MKRLDTGNISTIKRASRQGELPLSFVQQALWFMHRLDPDNTSYNIPIVLQLTGPLKMAALERALCEIVSRHEILRTCFPAVHGKPIQRIVPYHPLMLPVVDLSDLPDEQRRLRMIELVNQETSRRFDLARCPLFRAILIRLDNHEHVLLFTIHHIISDGWSNGVIFAEVAALYGAFLRDVPSTLAELDIQYADYAAWQQQHLSGWLLKSLLSYWKKQLAGTLPVLDLPTDRPRPPAQTHRGAKEPLQIASGLSKSLKDLSRRMKATLFMTMLSAFKVLLHRYTGQTDLVVGTPVAGRNQIETEKLIGPFINTLVLRTDTSGNPALRDLLRRVSRTAWEGFANQDLPFSLLVDELAPRRSPSHNPIFQVMFVFDTTTLPSAEIEGLKLTSLEVDSATAQFDLTLSIVDTARGLEGFLEFSTDLFDRSTIERMRGHFENILKRIVANPEARISDIPLLSESERQQLLSQWNRATHARRSAQCVHELFEAQAERTPEATALTFGSEHVSYAEMNRRANRLARRLQASGVQPESIVGLCAERCMEMVEGMIGVLKAGGAYLPLDPTYPKERLAFMLNDAGVKVLLCRRYLLSRLPRFEGLVICLGEDSNEIETSGAQNPVCAASLENPAYVLYTSGTTGEPKAVLNSHASLAGYASLMRAQISLTSSDRVLQFASMSFDVSVEEIFCTLLTGGALILPEKLISPARLSREMTRHAVTMADLPPAFWQQWAQELSRDNASLPPSLKLIIIGGEKIQPEAFATWQSAVGHRVRLANMYGVTEATISSTIHWAGAREEELKTGLPIGQPLENTTTFVLDQSMQPVPVGVRGELYIGGEGLARGYLNRPNLTAEKFIPHPFSNKAGARLYRTGDLTRYLPDGSLEFIRRTDQQVKVRGFRIELAEVEATLARHAAVREVAVTVCEDSHGGKHLAAYLCLDESQPVTVPDLRNFLTRMLPDYMIPSAFVTLKELPVTPNGKVDYKALPVPDRTRPRLEEEYVAPRNPMEEVIASVWSEILSVHRVGVHDDFFELGGHSLLATQIVARLGDLFGVELALRQMFETPTVARLTEALEEAKSGGPTVKAPPISRGSRKGDFPLSYAQQRLWFIDQLSPGTAAYIIPAALRLKGALNITALRSCLDEIVRRHESLRTTFAAVDAQPVQIIQPTLSLDLPVIDLQCLPVSARRAEAARIATEQVHFAFDLQQGPLLRARLLRLSEQEHVLIVAMHHLISDGWSMGVMVHELSSLYRAYCCGEPSPLPDLPVQYADFAMWQRDWLQGEILEAQLSYWRRQLAGAPELIELPADHPRPGLASFRGAVLPVNLPQSLSDSLDALSRKTGVTMFMTLLAVYQTLLFRYNGQPDIVVGAPIANRTRPELEGLIGFFVNPLVLRTDLSGDPSFMELLARVREVTLGAYAHQDLPFERLVDELHPHRDLGSNPVFQTAFALQNTPMATLELPGLTLSNQEFDVEVTRFDLEVHLREHAEGLKGFIVYSTDLFEPATISRVLDHFQSLLNGIAADPTRNISALPLLTDAEQKQLLIEWNNTPAHYSTDRLVHLLVAAQASRTPDALAISFGRQQLTYAELDRQANQLANYLRRLGVGPEVLTGICIDRSVEWIVGLLAILKAGGAFVPLDPAYPKARLAFMVEDSKVRVVLTTQLRARDFAGSAETVISLDSDWETISAENEDEPATATAAENLAYVIYTSGSTGNPKGVAITHGSLLNLIFWHQRAVRASASDRACQIGRMGFDASVWEVWPYLTIGASVCIVSDETRYSAEEIADWFVEEKITVSWLPPILAEKLILSDRLRQHIASGQIALRVLLSGADKLAHYPPDYLSFEYMNAYGPTEATVVTISGALLPEQHPERPPYLGRPVSNTEIYLLDERLQPVPIGVRGEMRIGGDSLARCYWNQPGMTAEKFTPDPFSGRPGRRLYKTGDFARYLPDGNIEFAGRVDNEIKIRGFRVNPAEIEAALAQHTIQQAAVIAREDTPGEKQLVAYVVANEDGRAMQNRLAQWQQQRVRHWQMLYEETYKQSARPQDPAFNIAGWNSSYTGSPIPEQEMRIWRDSTVERILSLRPREVLEIGCGSGLLLFPIAAQCEQYWGTDFSTAALEYLGEQVEARVGQLCRVTLLERMANEFEGIPEHGFDAVLLNSVAQYFPDLNYLLEVLRGAWKVIKPGGFIFLGDLRNYELMDAFHTSVELHKATSWMSVQDLKRRITANLRQEGELLIGPGLFEELKHSLPEISRVEILLKRGRHLNELTQFRYDAILHLAKNAKATRAEPAHTPSKQTTLDWARDALTLEKLQELLQEAPDEVLVTRAQNARVTAEVRAVELLAEADGLQTVAELREALAEKQPGGVDPEAVWLLGEQSGYSVKVGWSDSPGCFDVEMRRSAKANPINGAGKVSALNGNDIGDKRPLSSFANKPFKALIEEQLIPELRGSIINKLPDYMVPSVFVLLDKLPLTPNGKVDRRALPAPQLENAEQRRAYAAPRNQEEEILAGIWRQVLTGKSIGITDRFFDLGGDSLQATQVIGRIKEVFGIKIPLRNIFEGATIEEMAATIKQGRAADGIESAPRIVRADRTDRLPLSFAQQRLWFLAGLRPDSPFYNIATAVRLSGKLDAAALGKTFNEILRRHEVLRTNLIAIDGEPAQVIESELTLPMPVIDLTELPARQREAEAKRLALEESLRLFDLARCPLLRVTLLKLSEDEHLALLTMHHIISDGWSVGVLVKEIAVLYDAFSTGKASPLPDLEIQYADFAVWQREWLAGDVLDSQLAYWKQQLGGALPVLELPTDRPRPAVQTFNGASIPIHLPGSLVQKLKSFSQSQGATLFMTMLTGFDILLSRYSNQQEVVVGTAIANRNRAELEQLIGFFVNTLVLRVSLEGEPSFAEAVSRVREVTLGGYGHQEVPFEKVVEEMEPERDLSHSPLFQVMFVLQNAPLEELELPGLKLTPVEIEDRTAEFDLMVSVSESKGSIAGYIEYKTDLFDRDTILRLSGHFQRLLEAASDDPHQPISALPLLSEQEINQLLMESSGPEADFPASLCIHELFEARVNRTPDAVAVISNDRLVTYLELDERANRLAHYLRKLGVGPETMVGVCVRRSMEMIVGVLGIIKAGGAYVPLDPAYPAERLSLILKDCRTPLLLTLDSLTDDLPALDASVVRLDSDWDLIARESCERPVNTTRADNLLYVIYTSGSTGKPKGVAMHHRALSNMLSWQIQGPLFNDGARTLQFASLNFDVSFQEMFSTFFSGGTLLLVEEDLRRDVMALSHLLKEARVERLFLPFVALQQLAEASSGNGVSPDHLREIVTAGEQLKITPPVAALLSRLSRCSLENQYGPTEAHVVTSFELKGFPEEWPALPPIGKPINNVQVYVLDSQMRLVPQGVAGEVYIGGEGPGRGYLNRCDITAERFIPDPFGKQPGARLYKTGDVARHLADGMLEFLGRNDHQIKVRGYRVEPGEIETELARHPNVLQALVIAHEDKTGSKRLVGYVVVDKQANAGTAELRAYLKGKLPDYMVPSTFFLMDQLPLSPSGKVERRALPAPEQIELDTQEDFIQPRNPVEEILASIWSAVLDIERPGVSDNFFHVGGHSLLATQVVSRVRKAFGIEIAIRQLFEQPTLEGFSRVIESALRDGQVSEAPPIVRAQRGNDCPLSFAQQRLWFIDQLQPDNPSYNLPTAIRLIGHLDAEILRKTLSAIIQRHEALRTTFSLFNGKPAQVINPAGQVLLAVEDLTGLPEAEREAEAMRLADEEAQRPFNLEVGPLLRTLLLSLGEEDHIAVLTMHHIISDGWSMGVLVKELTILYEAFCSGEPSPLPDLGIQYADFAVWQREWLAGDVLDSQLAYWKQQLGGAPALLELPTDRPRPAVQTFNGASIPIHLPGSLAQKLKSFSQSQGATLFMTMLAGFDILLSRYSNQQEVVVGTAIANRNRAELEQLIGFFVNTLVLRVSLEGEPSFAEAVSRVREVTLGGYGHQEVPFEKVVEEMEPERDLSHSPLFQVMFAWQNAPIRELELTGLKLSPVTINLGITIFDMILNLYESGPTISGFLEYNSDLFDMSTINRMWGHFENLLERCLDDPDKPVSLLPMLSEAESHEIIVGWNQTRVDYPDKCVHRLFEAQAERTPDNVALVFNHCSLSYAELNAKANQLAHYLRELGVGLESLVGISMERGIDLIVAVLGVLKAGGAYVPIDPTYPAGRFAFMLYDTRATILLTQRDLLASLPELESTEIICLDDHWPLIAAKSERNLPYEISLDNLVYVIYTSGSTGQPKGAMNTHRGMISHQQWMQRKYPIEDTDRVIQLSSFSFDGSVWEILGSLAVGATLILPKTDGHKDSRYVAELIRDEAVTVVHFVPSMLGAFLKEESAKECSSLLQVFSGGEALSPDLAEEFYSRMGISLRNQYGPAEASIDVTYWDCDRNDENKMVPIGRPNGNNQIYILDKSLKPVPVGVTAEIYIGGVSVGRGYLRRPARTAERFIPDPYGQAGGERLYKTGDLGRYRADGAIEYLGRIDGQVKLRGIRIEPGEIEAVLRENEKVLEAAVVMREDKAVGKMLVGYVVTKQEKSITKKELKGYIRERLPEYMVPSIMVMLTEMPLTPSGKLDRRALPDIDEYRRATETVYEPPSNEIEQEIANVLQELLQLEKVGVHDNFFDLGAHSLLLAQVYNRLRENHKSDLQLLDFFKYPTISSLARHLRENGAPLKPGRDEALDSGQEVEIVESLSQGKDRLRHRFQQSRRMMTGEDANE